MQYVRIGGDTLILPHSDHEGAHRHTTCHYRAICDAPRSLHLRSKPGSCKPACPSLTVPLIACCTSDRSHPLWYQTRSIRRKSCHRASLVGSLNVEAEWVGKVRMLVLQEEVYSLESEITLEHRSRQCSSPALQDCSLLLFSPTPMPDVDSLDATTLGATRNGTKPKRIVCLGPGATSSEMCLGL